MRTNAIYNIVFNRKNVKLTPKDKSLLQIEIIFIDQSKQYISTGVYITSSQWDKKHQLVINGPSDLAINKKLADLIGSIRSHELRLNEDGDYLTRKRVIEFFRDPISKKNSFIEFMTTELAKRKDIVTATRYRHTLISEELKDLGIITFSELTYKNILRYDQWLRSKKLEQTTIHKRHSGLKTYIHLSMKLDRMKYEDNPYLKFEVSHGKSKIRIRLDSNEMNRIQNTIIQDPRLALVRDIFVFQMLTGIGYRDMIISQSQLVNNNGKYFLEGKRRKTGQYFSVYLLPDALAILNKYRSDDPDEIIKIPSQYEQNRKLKIVAALCGISKNISTNTARHTAATWLLLKGVPVTTIQRILGHSSVKTTQQYIHLLGNTIMEEMERADAKRQSSLDKI